MKKPPNQHVHVSGNIKDFQLSRRYGPLRHFCYAPYTSMFFSLHGKMAPCYATYNEKSDIFPDISIRESWLNGSFAQIREEHTHCRFDKNCSFCFELFKNKAYGSMLLQKYEHYAFSMKRYPVIMEFELNNRCNLECIMCDANLSSTITKKQGLPGHDDVYGEEFYEQLKEFIPHLQMAEFTGGDPFLIESYYKIWDLIINQNPACNILITTNANTMSPRIERLMAETKKLHFNISIDALNKDLYESIRVNGDFNAAIKNIDLFNKYCKKNKTSINLLVCPMTVNYTELPKLIDFGNSKGIGVFFHTVVKPQHLSFKFQEPSFLNELINYLNKFRFGSKTQTERTNLSNYRNLIGLIESWKNEIETQKAIHPMETTIDVVKNRLKHVNDPETLKKAIILEQYINSTPFAKEIINGLNNMDAEYIYQLILEKNEEEIINFMKKEFLKDIE